MNHRSAQFLWGEWKLLFEAANDDFQIQNEWDQHHVQNSNDSRCSEIMLEQARNLNYSRAMSILRSPCLGTIPLATIINQRHDLHPPETVTLLVGQP